MVLGKRPWTYDYADDCYTDVELLELEVAESLANMREGAVMLRHESPARSPLLAAGSDFGADLKRRNHRNRVVTGAASERSVPVPALLRRSSRKRRPTLRYSSSASEDDQESHDGPTTSVSFKVEPCHVDSSDAHSAHSGHSVHSGHVVDGKCVGMLHEVNQPATTVKGVAFGAAKPLVAAASTRGNRDTVEGVVVAGPAPAPAGPCCPSHVVGTPVMPGPGCMMSFPPFPFSFMPQASMPFAPVPSFMFNHPADSLSGQPLLQVAQ